MTDHTADERVDVEGLIAELRTAAFVDGTAGGDDEQHANDADLAQAALEGAFRTLNHQLQEARERADGWVQAVNDAIAYYGGTRPVEDPKKAGAMLEHAAASRGYARAMDTSRAQLFAASEARKTAERQRDEAWQRARVEVDARREAERQRDEADTQYNNAMNERLVWGRRAEIAERERDELREAIEDALTTEQPWPILRHALSKSEGGTDAD
jgi:hypothetical protein